MRYRKLTQSGDYSFGAGAKNFYIDVPDAVAQAVQTRLLLFLGEFFLDITDGTPYFQGVLGKHSQSTADATIQDRILNTQGMDNIASYSSDIDPVTRKYSASATINTIYGTTEIDIANEQNY